MREKVVLARFLCRAPFSTPSRQVLRLTTYERIQNVMLRKTRSTHGLNQSLTRFPPVVERSGACTLSSRAALRYHALEALASNRFGHAP
eukprot:1698027-Prymnesium_polylepis.2